MKIGNYKLLKISSNNNHQVLRIGRTNKLSSFVELVVNKLPILMLHINFSTILKTLEILLKTKRTFNQNKVVAKINILKQIGTLFKMKMKNHQSSMPPLPFGHPNISISTLRRGWYHVPSKVGDNAFLPKINDSKITRRN
jgi:hypothetical protein